MHSSNFHHSPYVLLMTDAICLEFFHDCQILLIPFCFCFFNGLELSCFVYSPDEELQDIRKRNLKRKKARKMDLFCRKLKAQPEFRKALRPGVSDHTTFMVPLDQISPQHDIVLSQEPKQQEVLVNSTRLSIDNNHKCAPWWAERTLSMRALLHNRQWFWVGDFLCLRKDEELHQRATKILFDK